MRPLFLSFVYALIITAAVEAVIMFLLTRNIKHVYYALLCNMLTNPALNLAVAVFAPLLGLRFYPLLVAVLELAAVAVEACVLRVLALWSWKKAFAISLLLNAASFLFGCILPLLGVKL